MRLFEIVVSCFNKDEDELLGTRDFENDVPGRAMIDLDSVTSFWENPLHQLCIYVGPATYWTKGITYDEFVKKMFRAVR